MAFETYVVIEGLGNSACRVRNMLASAPFPILASSAISHQAFFYFSKISLNLMCAGLGKKIGGVSYDKVLAKNFLSLCCEEFGPLIDLWLIRAFGILSLY